jgi:hypothetical protein
LYAATVAPTVTFWDPGELIAAVESFGIPHPPGTPLYVVLARAWSELLGPLPRVLATNLFSALCTAVAGATLARLLARATGDGVSALAGALCAGAMSTVWLNATETEVYAASLLLSMIMLWAAERAGASGNGGWLAIVAYAVALAVPLHLSALVAAPAAIALATHGVHDVRWREAALLLATLVLVVGAGLASAWIAGAGLLAMGATLLTHPRDRLAGAARLPLGVLLGLSALAMLPLRAAHDPAVNAGNPIDWKSLWEVVGRQQYGGHALWPRQAPLWIQLGNLVEYADWQVALGLSPGVAPSWTRTPFTLLFVGLGVYGALVHRRRDVRGWRAFALLFLSAGVGLVLYLNFKAGASFGYGVLPDNAPHEVRERDYFFELAFWTWGAWAGVGAVALASRLHRATAVGGLLVAMLPIALNWRVANRRREPEAGVARQFAEALLWSAPRGAVLVTGGDNDSFPLWYAQVVNRTRADVTVVTMPLLGARWYRAQLARRDSLLGVADVDDSVASEGALLERVAERARERERPIAVAITVDSSRRELLGGQWSLHGLAYVRPTTASRVHVGDTDVDTAAARAFVRRFGATRAARDSESIDPAPAAFLTLLSCPATALAAAGGEAPPDSLDSRCKLQ